jgi:FMN-dependent NADH-azoreductase
MADTDPRMADLKPLARESLQRAFAQIDRLWEADAQAA